KFSSSLDGFVLNEEDIQCITEDNQTILRKEPLYLLNESDLAKLKGKDDLLTKMKNTNNQLWCIAPNEKISSYLKKNNINIANLLKNGVFQYASEENQASYCLEGYDGRF